MPHSSVNFGGGGMRSLKIASPNRWYGEWWLFLARSMRPQAVTAAAWFQSDGIAVTSTRSQSSGTASSLVGQRRRILAVVVPDDVARLPLADGLLPRLRVEPFIVAVIQKHDRSSPNGMKAHITSTMPAEPDFPIA